MITIRNLLIKLRFIGTAYHGFQIQQNALTVQQVFQEAVKAVIGYTPDIKGCSRTDSGVHAYEYALSTTISSDISEYRLKAAINHHLPDDISVISISAVADDFHARYSCVAKRYRYIVYNDDSYDPFLVDRALHIRQPIDINLLNEAAQCFVGEHDFKPFSAAKGTLENTVRTVYSAYFEQQGKLSVFLITADGFLYKMVRIIVGLLLEVNAKRVTKEDIEKIFATQKRTVGCITASAKGLYLDKVFYNVGEINEQYT